jgi:hypothetical protein
MRVPDMAKTPPIQENEDESRTVKEALRCK